MTISTQAVTAALRYLHASGHVRAVEGQAAVWQDVISDALPEATDADLHPAVRRYVQESTSSWTTAADVLPFIRREARARYRATWCGHCDEHTRQVLDEDTVRRCATCHPLRNKPIVQIDHDTSPRGLARLGGPELNLPYVNHNDL